MASTASELPSPAPRPGDVRPTGLAAALHDERPAVVAATLLVTIGYLPMVLLGPGTDLDVGGVYRAGQSILDGGYDASRRPGAPVHEAAAGVLHALGGPVLANLGSVAMAVVAAGAVVALLRRDGNPWAGWYGVATLANPFVWIAGTSMIDHLWGVALILIGANLQLARRPVATGAVYALAAGCRLSLLVVAAAMLAGEVAHRGVTRRDVRVPAVAALITLVGSAILFALVALAEGPETFRSEVPSSTAVVQLARWGVKNLAFFGPVVVALLAAVAPRTLRAIPTRWSDSATLRLGVAACLATEVLFVRFPWKLAHLLPAWFGLVLVLGASRALRRPAVLALVAAQLVAGVVTVQVAEPDRPNAATGGRFDPRIEAGPLVRDLRCRIDSDHGAYRRDDGAAELLATWDCVVPWSDDA